MIFSFLALFAFQSGSLRPAAKPESPTVTQAPPLSSPQNMSTPLQQDRVPAIPVTNVERSAVSITSLDIDLHLIPTASRLEAHTKLQLRNNSSNVLTRIPLQLSSTLRWQSLSLETSLGLKPITFTQSPVATDADHTGYAQEAVLALPEPLAPGALLTVSTFYTGEIRQSSARLELLGAPAEQAALIDWDQITPEITALRGFGNVLWYPVSAPTALLGDTNRLFRLIGENRAQQSSSLTHLRLTVEYVGEAPKTAIFNGHTNAFQETKDTQDSLVPKAHGLAVADFSFGRVGTRTLSLFITTSPTTITSGQLLAIATSRPEIIDPLTAVAARVEPLVTQWLGAASNMPLTILDHPGQTFEDDALLVTPVEPFDQLAPKLTHSLSHTRLTSSHLWIDEGIAQFMNLLWTERTEGRAAVVTQLQQAASLVALAEPDPTSKIRSSDSSLQIKTTEIGQSLISTSSEIFFRTKAAGVWWQLRGIVGDEVLKQALVAYSQSERSSSSFDENPKAMQHTVESIAKQDLSWFFDDWVYRDRGLPDLSIVSVSPRPLPVRPGKEPGFLVAVEVRNDGDAVADVPVIVRSGALSASERLRVPARSLASIRIVFEGTPEEVQVNDGTTAELATTIHTRLIQINAGKS